MRHWLKLSKYQPKTGLLIPGTITSNLTMFSDVLSSAGKLVIADARYHVDCFGFILSRGVAAGSRGRVRWRGRR